MTALPPHAGKPLVTAGAPLGSGAGVMIMVHGRNAAPQNILTLTTAFDRPDFTYLAPAAAGGTWYPHSFMAPIENNQPWLDSALSVLHAIVADLLERDVPQRRIMLLGFSQGACLTGEFAVRNAAGIGGVVLYSGGLIGPPGTRWDQPGSFDGTPVFLGCSDVDAHVPKARVEESAEVFERMGADVTSRIYPGMGHLVNDDEIEFVRDLMTRVAA